MSDRLRECARQLRQTVHISLDSMHAWLKPPTDPENLEYSQFSEDDKELMCLAQVHDTLRAHLISRSTSEQRKARRRLLKAYNLPHHRHCNHAYCRQRLQDAILDLDAVLFHGALRGRVRFEWSEELVSRHWIAWTTPPLSENNEAPEPLISLHTCNAWYGGRFNTRACIWGTLVHEMLHAYIMLRAKSMGLRASDDEEWCCGEFTYHGPLFVETSRQLVKRLRLRGLKLESVVDMRGRCHLSEESSIYKWYAEDVLGCPFLGWAYPINVSRREKELSVLQKVTIPLYVVTLLLACMTSTTLGSVGSF